MRLVFLGSPGVGKGTQAKRLSKQYSVPQVATGDMLRAAISKGTAEGKEAKSYVDSGRLVPDHLVIRIVQARLLEDDMRNGFILDGFPRTKEQADALFEMGVGIDKVLNFYLDEKILVSRIEGRRTCSKCNEIYHMDYHPPVVVGICDRCGIPLIHRKDDKAAVVKERLIVYQKETAPLTQYYEKQGCLFHIDANGSVEDVARRIQDACRF
ncbi:MAG: adenylate kinase [Nitrospirae bacterium]|nr:adenylate kinase [Candidatus Troglogloeales bacterium]